MEKRRSPTFGVSIRVQSAGILAFTLSQNEFLYALLSLTKSSVRPVPIGVVGALIREDAFYWGQLMAGALPGSISVALIYSSFVKYYVAGLTAGQSRAGGAPGVEWVRVRIPNGTPSLVAGLLTFPLMGEARAA